MVLFSEQCAFNSVNSGNMKQRNSLTSNNKQTGRRPADMLDIYKLIYLIWPVWSLQQDWKISNVGPFFRFSWDRQKLLVTLPRWRSLCHSLARDQPQPGSFSNDQGRQRRETLGTRLTLLTEYWTNDVKSAARCKLLNHWRQKCSPLQIIEPLTEKTWGRGCVNFGERKTKKCLNSLKNGDYFDWIIKQNYWIRLS